MTDTTPTPADHEDAKRFADRCRLSAEPWQLEHLAVAIAEVRAEGRTEAFALAADIATRVRETQVAPATPRESEAAAIAEAREQGRIEGAERLFSALGIGAHLLRQWADHLEGLGVVEGRGLPQ